MFFLSGYRALRAQELEQLVSQLDAGQLPLDQLLTRYQRGAALLAFCRDRLTQLLGEETAIEIRGLRFAYGDDPPVLDGLDLASECQGTLQIAGEARLGAIGTAHRVMSLKRTRNSRIMPDSMW